MKVMSLRLDNALMKRIARVAKKSDVECQRWWPDNPLAKYTKPATRTMIIRAAILEGLDVMEKRRAIS
jgi:predicted transcriptional regulator